MAADGDPRPFLAGVILAAGASRRMGRPKQLLRLDDRAMVQHVLDAAVASSLDEIVVVLGHEAAQVGAAIRLPVGRSVRVTVNPEWASGQSGSLRRGLRAVDPRAAAVAILLADQPHLTAELIDRVAAAFLAGAAPVVRPVYAGGRVPGHPVFLARRIWPEVDGLRGDQGARALLAAHPEWLRELPVAGEPPLDVDTAEDYERALARAGAS
jgi:molybdenum cofactor cytidylyltransferase